MPPAQPSVLGLGLDSPKRQPYGKAQRSRGWGILVGQEHKPNSAQPGLGWVGQTSTPASIAQSLGISPPVSVLLRALSVSWTYAVEGSIRLK